MGVLRLSIEEMAYVMGVLQGSSQAGAFLKSMIGEREQKEIEGRLIAAAHSLLAHGWLSLEDEHLNLNDDLHAKILHLAESSYSIRMSKTVRGREEIVSYFFRGGQIIEFRLENAVVSCLETIDDRESFLNRARTFWEISADVQEERLSEEAIVPGDILDIVRKDAETGKKERALELLVSKGVKESTGAQLVNDMESANWRGSILRMEPNGDLVSAERGFLLLKGMERLWLFALVEKPTPEVHIFPGNSRTFHELLMELVA